MKRRQPQRPLVRVKGKLYDANAWQDYRDKVARMHAVMQYFAELAKKQRENR